ncbi:MAG: LysM peptidoglycan-binding domain-containing protein [Actinomycetes bacterium]
MAAVIDFTTARRISQPHERTTDPSTLRGAAAPIVRGAGALAPVLPQSTLVQRPPLRMIHGGRSATVIARRRMYLRRRIAAGIALVVVALVLAQLVGAVASHLFASGTPSTAAVAEYQVQPGDTLWSVAGEYLPQMNRSDAVAKLLVANPELASVGGRLTPGETLDLPSA